MTAYKPNPLMKERIDMIANIVHSPDDEDATGKGWYAYMTCPATGAIRKESVLMKTKFEAVAWSEKQNPNHVIFEGI